MVVDGVGLAGRCATLALAITIAVRYQAGNGGYQLVSRPRLGAVARASAGTSASTGSRCSWC